MTDPLWATDSKLNLRFATEDDVGLILEFIMALAKFERLSHEVTTDENSLRNTLFGDRKIADVVLADYDGNPAGFALFFHNFSTFVGKPGLYLEDLYVKTEFRGFGIGHALLSCLARIALARKCGRLEWSVLDWNEPAIKFYKKLGGQAMDGWKVFRVSDETLSELAKSDR